MKDGKFETERFRRRIRARDREAWGELIHAYGPLLLAVARRVLPGRLDPEAMAQETWTLGLWRAPRYDTGKALYPWLCSICLNLCRSCLRRDKLWRFIRRSGPGVTQKISLSSTFTGEEAEDHAWLRGTVARLKRVDREIIYLRFVCGLGFEAIAEALSLSSTDAARQRLSRALARLRRQIEEDGTSEEDEKNGPGEGPEQ